MNRALLMKTNLCVSLRVSFSSRPRLRGFFLSSSSSRLAPRESKSSGALQDGKLENPSEPSSTPSGSPPKIRATVVALGSKLDIAENDLDAWFKVDQRAFSEAGGSELLSKFGSMRFVLSRAFPERQWPAFRFGKVPRGYFDSPEHQREFIEYVSNELNIRELDEWYVMSSADLARFGGVGIPGVSGKSISNLLASVYPNHPWDVSRFSFKPQNYWTSLENQKRFMDDMGKKIGIRNLEDWYSISVTSLAPFGASSILKLYGGTLSKLLPSVYPNHPWDISKFSVKPHKYWSSIENQRNFMDDLGRKLGLKDLDGWYSISTTQMIPFGATSLLQMYDRSLSKLLRAVYPNHKWEVARFSHRPQNYWAAPENQKRFMDDLGKQIGINSEADFDKWYEQSGSLLEENGGLGLFARHGKSLPKLLTSVYPSFNWNLWRFAGRIDRVLESDEEVEKLFENLEAALEIKNPEDWYRVTAEQLAALKVSSSLYRSNTSGLVALLSKRYPEIEWDENAFFGRGYRRASHRWLTAMLSDLFGSNMNVLVDYTHPDLKVHLDIFFPELSLAFEYQGVQHYKQLGVYGDLNDRILARDEIKLARCKARGITLIAVPYWWSKKRPALLAAILAERPDLFQNKLSAFLEEARRGSSGAS